MYTAHYGLKIKPFQISSDSKFMWLGENHKEALATLRYGILDNKGNLIGDSFFNGSNMGCPASEKEVAAFIALLTKTSKIDEKGLSVISERFRKNESH